MMAIRMTALHHWKILAQDGEVGTIADLLFDDRAWGARYIVAETGGWLASRRVLLSPASVRRRPGEIGMLHVDFTREQVRSAPDIDTALPVSRHHEIAHALHYGYPADWAAQMGWAGGVYPGVAPIIPRDVIREGSPDPAENARRAAEHERAAQDTHLRSARELVGYRIEATDGDAGDLDDLDIDIETWGIRGLLVDTRRWWPGGLVLVGPSAVAEIRWADRAVRVTSTREQVKDAPKPG
jgi:hypothetical protein